MSWAPLFQTNPNPDDTSALLSGTFWWYQVYCTGGGQENKRNWDYWNFIRTGVKDPNASGRDALLDYRIYSLDDSDTLRKYDLSFNLLDSATVNNPRALDIDPQYVFTGSDGDGVVRHSKANLSATVQGPTASTTDVTVAADRSIYAATGEVRKIEPDTMTEEAQSSTGGSIETLNDDGTSLFCGESSNDRIRELSLDTLQQLQTSGVNGVTQMVTDSEHIYTAEGLVDYYKYNKSNLNQDATTSKVAATNFTKGIVFARSGNIVATYGDTGGNTHLIELDTSLSTVRDVDVSGNLTGPITGIVQVPDGRFFVSTAGGEIVEFDASFNFNNNSVVPAGGQNVVDIVYDVEIRYP